MLEQIAHFNDLSPKLRKTLEDKIESYGKKVRYKFAISNNNPDPQKENGPIIWPTSYTLDPIVFNIVDTDEERSGKSRSKRIGMVDKQDEKGIPVSFKRVRVLGKNEGIYDIELKDEDGRPIEEGLLTAMYMELHPKLNKGLFQDKKRIAIFSLIDEKKASQEAREARSARTKAVRIAEEMSDEKVKQFASANGWNELEDIDILREMVEAEAERDPVSFNKLVESKKMEYQATVKRALVANVISYDPVGGKILWGSNQQVIIALGVGSAESEVVQFAEFLMTNGKKADDIYKKIESLSKV